VSTKSEFHIAGTENYNHIQSWILFNSGVSSYLRP